jgi:NitT/TauT family transport system permease protein
VGLLVVYQAVAELAFPRSLFVASPVQIVAQGWRVFQDPRVVGALGVTAAEFGLAFVLAAVTGVAAGLVLGANRVTRRVGEDVLQVLFALPQVAVYPLFLLFLGLGFTCKVAFGVTHGFFPVALSTLAGRARVEDGLPRAVRAMGGGRLAVATKAILPSMLPDVLTGLRLGASLALLGVLLAELMASSGGLGAVLSHLAGAFRPAQLYALVAAVCVFAVVVNWAMTMLQRRATRWSP